MPRFSPSAAIPRRCSPALGAASRSSCPAWCASRGWRCSWAAVREDDTAAASLGINPPLVKLLAFAIGAGVAGVAGAGFAQLFGYVEPTQFDFTVSLMVLAAVVIGGQWGVLGALAIGAYDRFLVEGITAGLHALGAALGSPALSAADLRQHNFVVFGVALLLATLYRARLP